MDIELMINDEVPFLFGNKFAYGDIVGIKIVTDIVGSTDVVNGRVGVFTDRTYTVIDHDGAIRSDFKQENFQKAADKRLEQIRKELRAERVSTGELVELAALKQWIKSGDTELQEAAGVPEEEAW